MQNRGDAISLNTKPHYVLLDGLRGVVALMVVFYHVFEAYASNPFDQFFNHGYLAVDFFFILSGFVVGYAYDDRWNAMTKCDFFKRRLVRLHPMLVMGALLGVAAFVIQGSEKWTGEHVDFIFVLLAFLLNFFLIPAMPNSPLEVRGNAEMFPLNGPTWSLFFEYIGNVIYALFIHRLSTRALKFFVGFMALILCSMAVFNFSGYGHMGMGWTLVDGNWVGGLVRMLFSYSAGLLVVRIFKPIKIKHAFIICSSVLFCLFLMPYLGTQQKLWINGLYDSFCIIIIFPCLLWIGASGVMNNNLIKICRLLGNLSYPLYMVHYPLMYLFYAYSWRFEPHLSFAQSWQPALAVYFGSILMAFVCYKWFDTPIRKLLTNKFLK